jgi:hypothetical protein
MGISLNNSSALIRNCIIENNVNGGIAVLNSTPHAIIRNNIIRNNVGPTYGGGIFVNDSYALIDSNLIYQNTGGSGGGIDGHGGSMTVRKNIICNNICLGEYGGAIIIISMNSAVENNTIYGNNSSGTSSGQLYISGSTSWLKNNIISSGNKFGIYVYGSTVAHINYTCIYGNDSGRYHGVFPEEGNIFVDPLFIWPNSYDFSLYANSPCINAGDPMSPLDPDDSRADMGAIWFNPTYRLLDFHLIFPLTPLIDSLQPTQFIWHKTTDIDSGYQVYYKFFYDDNSSFTSPESSGVLSDTTYSIAESLSRSHGYYWRVKAFNYHATPTHSNETWNFYLDGYPLAPAIIAPPNGITIDSLSWLSWLLGSDPDAMDTVKYTLQADNDPAFGSPEINVSGITKSGVLLEEAVAVQLRDLAGFHSLQAGNAYYWRVRSDDLFGLHSSYTSGTNYFLYGVHVNHAPNPPTSGFNPANALEISTNQPTISWNNAIDPDPDDNTSTLIYGLLLYSSDSSTVYQYSTSAGINQVALPIILPDNTFWRYRVKTTDDQALSSGWSAVQDFWVRLYNLSPLPAVSGFSPANDSELITALPAINWNPAGDPDSGDSLSTLHYILQLDFDGEFDTSIARQYTTSPGQNYHNISDSLTEDQHWVFRIRTVDDGGLMSGWSQLQSFWTNYHNQAPNLPIGGLYPANGQIINTSHPDLIWSTSIDPDPADYPARLSYQIQVDNDGEFDTTVAYPYIVSAGITHLTVPDSLTENGHWYFRVRAVDFGGLMSGWTPIQNFWVDQTNSPPERPLSGFSPANGEEIIDLTPTFIWQSAIDPDPQDGASQLSYIFELDTDTLFSGFVYRDTSAIGDNFIQIADALSDNTHYFYRLKTIDHGGLTSAWSANQNFYTNHYNYPPQPFALIAPNNGQLISDEFADFKWRNTIDYDPLSSFQFYLQYCGNSLFNSNVKTIACNSDTSLSILTDSLALIGDTLYWRVMAIDDDSLIRIGGISEQFRLLLISLGTPCNYMLGDMSGDGQRLGGDVTYGVRFFKGIGTPPRDSCYMDSTSAYLYVAGDCNGDCQFRGADITRLVSYFKGYSQLSYCHFFPPAPLRNSIIINNEK